MSTNKKFLAGNRNRLMAFWVGIVVFLGGSGYLIYTLTNLSGWKETSIIGRLDTGNGCSMGKNDHGTIKRYTYSVDGQSYTNDSCSSGNGNGVRVISYNPDKPSEAMINGIIVYKIVGIGVAILGAITLLGALFASDKKNPGVSVKK